MRRVISKDGTSIAYEAVGTGPAVVLVGGGLDDGSENAPLAGELARSFTVYNYARRGRGDSGDTPPYSVEREIEDIEALLVAAGGTAHLYGVSTGGALVLEAPAASVRADKLAVYEVPYNTADDWPPPEGGCTAPRTVLRSSLNQCEYWRPALSGVPATSARCSRFSPPPAGGATRRSSSGHRHCGTWSGAQTMGSVREGSHRRPRWRRSGSAYPWRRQARHR
jgi:hypothetical protein